MPTPTISICIPAFNAERYLEAALLSVAAQYFPHWEVIVTEDGSQDGTEEIVRRFASTVPQSVRYERHEQNRGLAATRNTGIAAAKGAWIAFLDADDCWLPNHLEVLVAKTGSADMVFSGTIPFEGNSDNLLAPLVPTTEDLLDLPAALYSGRLSVLPSAVMLRRDIFESVGLVSTDYPCVNDTEYWLRLLRAGKTAVYSGAATCLYRKHEASMSRRLTDMLIDSARLCEAYADWKRLPRALRHRRPAELYRWAAASIRRENPARAIEILRLSLRNEFLNLKSLGLLGMVTLQRLTRGSPASQSS